jgi:hypothetical protein
MSSSSSSSTAVAAAAAASRYWEEEKLEAELAKVHGLIAVEMAAGWSVCPIGDARRHISAELAAVVPESLTEEAAATLMLPWSNVLLLARRPHPPLAASRPTENKRGLVAWMVWLASLTS